MKDIKKSFEGEDKAVITSVVPLTDAQLEQIKNFLIKKFGHGIIIEKIVDKKVLGGFSVAFGDWYLDATLKTDLYNLKKNIL
ncbi:hypothetical protein A2W14_06710 [Candidatus Gottesmanbacteria bacterium RBG_16_37_8]|uniref:Uncharacterized protein n=1 Tax=Candidatus Gottesmanbacteria bacterium RBG_16_37_8 TaxID=1798371 RepID=A0A1F5YWF4_9BACT|nr:MAG: hypothetical protein A2W14_06710 [Candidatus Gottesmanbacteria bacterium RBG_16_37_8]